MPSHKNQLRKLKIGMHVPINVFQKFNWAFLKILIFCQLLIKGGGQGRDFVFYSHKGKKGRELIKGRVEISKKCFGENPKNVG